MIFKERKETLRVLQVKLVPFLVKENFREKKMTLRSAKQLSAELLLLLLLKSNQCPVSCCYFCHVAQAPNTSLESTVCAVLFIIFIRRVFCLPNNSVFYTHTELLQTLSYKRACHSAIFVQRETSKLSLLLLFENGFHATLLPLLLLLTLLIFSLLLLLFSHT